MNSEYFWTLESLYWLLLAIISRKWKWSRSVLSDSLRPPGLQPTRLLCPWDSPGKNTGVGCCCCCCCQVTSVVSDSVRPRRQKPTSLPHPWDSPGKNTGVGCHFLLQCMQMKSESEVVQSCPTLRDPMDCSLPGSSVHGIFQARVLEWVANLLLILRIFKLNVDRFYSTLQLLQGEAQVAMDYATHCIFSA